eukprot:Clim_evm74s218 gene=Clim_evmTU74s218
MLARNLFTRTAVMAPRFAVANQAIKPTAILAARNFRTQVPQRNQSSGLFGSINNVMSQKTGQTGGILFSGALGVYLFSKEILILHSETVVLGCFGAFVYLVYSKAGDGIREFFTTRAADIENELSQARFAAVDGIKEQIESLQYNVAAEELTKDSYQIAQDANEMAAELAVRLSKHEYRNQAVKYLDFLIETEKSEARKEQDELVAYVEDAVRKGMTPKIEEENLELCIKQLENMK